MLAPRRRDLGRYVEHCVKLRGLHSYSGTQPCPVSLNALFYGRLRMLPSVRERALPFPSAGCDADSTTPVKRALQQSWAPLDRFRSEMRQAHR